MEAVADTTAGNGKYIRVQYGTADSYSSMPNPGYAEYSFNLSVSGNVDIWLKARSCGSDGDSLIENDSFWIDLTTDNTLPLKWNGGIKTTDWQWYRVCSKTLRSGSHTLRIAYRETGAFLDQLMITTSGASPNDYVTTEPL